MKKTITIFTVDHAEYASTVLSKHLQAHGHLVNRIYVSKTLFDFRFLKRRFWFFIKNRYPFCVRMSDWARFIKWQLAPNPMYRDDAVTYFSERGFDTRVVRNINAPSFIDEVKQLDSDVFLFALFNQIARPPFLEVPHKGVFNLHMGKLPEYRGGLSAFWVLRHNDPTAGVTMHEAVPKLDAGQIVAEARFPVKTNSMRTLMTETAEHAADVVADGIEKILTDTVQPVDTTGRPEAYMYIPTYDDFKAFYAIKNRLI